MKKIILLAMCFSLFLITGCSSETESAKKVSSDENKKDEEKKEGQNTFIIGDVFTFDNLEWTTSNQRVVTDLLGEEYIVFDVTFKALKDDTIPNYLIKGVNAENQVFDSTFPLVDDIGDHISLQFIKLDTNQTATGYVAFKKVDGVIKTEFEAFSFTSNDKTVTVNLLPY